MARTSRSDGVRPGSLLGPPPLPHALPNGPGATEVLRLCPWRPVQRHDAGHLSSSQASGLPGAAAGLCPTSGK